MVVTVRLPAAFDSVTSAELQRWIAEFLKAPFALPADPGAGGRRVSVWLDSRRVRLLSAYLDCSTSEALRRLIRARVHHENVLEQRTAPARPAKSRSVVALIREFRARGYFDGEIELKIIALGYETSVVRKALLSECHS